MNGPDVRPSPYLYPTLVGCIAEGRSGARHEIKRVAVRIRDEAFSGPAASCGSRIATYRKVWRAARAALNGHMPSSTIRSSS